MKAMRLMAVTTVLGLGIGCGKTPAKLEVPLFPIKGTEPSRLAAGKYALSELVVYNINRSPNKMHHHEFLFHHTLKVPGTVERTDALNMEKLVWGDGDKMQTTQKLPLELQVRGGTVEFADGVTVMYEAKADKPASLAIATAIYDREKFDEKLLKKPFDAQSCSFGASFDTTPIGDWEVSRHYEDRLAFEQAGANIVVYEFHKGNEPVGRPSIGQRMEPLDFYVITKSTYVPAK